MRYQEYFYNCSPEYAKEISPHLLNEVRWMVSKLRARRTQGEMNQDIAWLLASRGWNFSSFPQSMPQTVPADLGVDGLSKEDIEPLRSAAACVASTVLDHRFVMDFSKAFGPHRVYLEAQFGKKEASLMDFCKLRIAYRERHLSLGIELLMYDPNAFFAHRRAAVSGMATFGVAKEILPVLGLECPIWLIGLEE